MPLLASYVKCEHRSPVVLPDIAMLQINPEFIDWCRQKANAVMCLGGNYDENSPLRLRFMRYPCTWIALPTSPTTLQNGYVVTECICERLKQFSEWLSHKHVVDISSINLDQNSYCEVRIDEALYALYNEEPDNPKRIDNVFSLKSGDHITEIISYGKNVFIRFEAGFFHYNMRCVTYEMSLETLYDLTSKHRIKIK